MISVIIPVYNRAQTLKKSLDSLTKQKYTDFEVILVNDGSSENILEIFTQFQNKLNIKYFQKENGGAPSARNFGFKKSSGNYIIFFDADIIARPEMFLEMKKVLDNESKIDFVYSDYFFANKKMTAKNFDKNKLQKNNYIHTSALIRREKVISWDENLKKFQDWDYFLTLSEKKCLGFYLAKTLYQIIGGGSMSFWLPSFAYKIPFRFLPFFYQKIKKYELARQIIFKKHNLC